MSQADGAHNPAERIHRTIDLVCPRGHFIRQMHLVFAPPWAEGRILPFGPELGTPPDEMPDGDLFRRARQSADAERRITIKCPSCTYAGPKKVSDLEEFIIRQAFTYPRRIRLPD